MSRYRQTKNAPVKFVTELPKDGRKLRTNWEAVANKLRDRPGEWALVGRYTYSTGYQIRRGMLKGFTPVGAFEVTTRRFGGDGKADTYVRYLGEDVELEAWADQEREPDPSELVWVDGRPRGAVVPVLDDETVEELIRDAHLLGGRLPGFAPEPPAARRARERRELSGEESAQVDTGAVEGPLEGTQAASGVPPIREVARELTETRGVSAQGREAEFRAEFGLPTDPQS